MAPDCQTVEFTLTPSVSLATVADIYIVKEVRNLILSWRSWFTLLNVARTSEGRLVRPWPNVPDRFAHKDTHHWQGRGCEVRERWPTRFHAWCSLGPRRRLVFRLMVSTRHDHDDEMGFWPTGPETIVSHSVPRLILPRPLRNAMASHDLSGI